MIAAGVIPNASPRQNALYLMHSIQEADVMRDIAEPAPFELYAIRYATNRKRKRGQNFILEARPDDPLTLDFYSWVAIGPAGTFVIDTGMARAKAERHGHEFLHCPIDSLRELGVDPAAQTRLVITHLHYDHIGNVDAFPAAVLELQKAEMDYVVSPFMQKAWCRRAYETDEIGHFIELLHRDRLVLHGPDKEIAPGLSVHLVGGHCAGQEIVRVWTRRGWMVPRLRCAALLRGVRARRSFRGGLQPCRDGDRA